MKPKCPKCGKSLDSPNNLWGRTDGASTVACFCGWSRRVSRAAIIRIATQGKCKRVTREGVLVGGDCGYRGYPTRRVPRYCEGCGKPVEVVNG